MKKFTYFISTMLVAHLLSASDSTKLLNDSKLFENSEVLLTKNETEKRYALMTPKAEGAVMEVTLGKNNEISSISASTVRSPTAGVTISYNPNLKTNRIQLFLSKGGTSTLMIDLNGDGAWDIRTDNSGRSINIDGNWLIVDKLKENEQEMPIAEINGRKFSFSDKWRE